jgi:tryptophan synthase alpha chain
MSQIFLIAPTTDRKRQMYILSQASGFIYCVALKGVTGAKSLEFGDLSEQIASVRSISDIPIAIGFGVKDVDSAVSIAQFSDAIVIGSALVERLDKCHNQQDIEQAIENFIKPIAQAINQGK